MEITHFYKTTTKWAVVLALVFSFGCTLSISNNSKVSTSIAKNKETTNPVQSPYVTDIQQDVQPQGTLVLSCQNGIYQLDLKSKTFTTLDSDKTRLFFDVGWNRNGIYYLRTTDLKEHDLPAGGQFGPNDVFEIKPSSKSIEQLTNDDYYDFNLAVSPHNNYLVYASDRIEPDHSPNRYKLVMMDVDGKVEKILANGVNQFLPIWSPNGDQIAILEIPTTPDEKAELFLYDLHQGKLNKLLLNEHVLPTRIAWSPDQKYIAVGVQNSAEFRIDLVNILTGAVESVISVSEEPRNLVWSPDGKKILFETRAISNGNDAATQLKIIDVLQETTILLYRENGKLLDYNAEWSPGSGYIAFFVDADHLNKKLIIQDIATLKEVYFEIPCSRVSNAVWIISP